MKTALVLGAGGFIGSHLVKRLKSEGYWVRGVDLKYPEFSESPADEFLIYDLRDPKNAKAVIRLDYLSEGKAPLPFQYSSTAFSVATPFDEIYQLAADMGGAGYVFTGDHDADIMHNSATINCNVAYYASEIGAGKLFYSSSACMYPAHLQAEIGYVQNVLERDSYSLSESDAYPANPDSEYGWEKLFSERLYLAYARNHKLNVRIARFHNIYGPEGTYRGGKEKAPAAMCRKVVENSNVCQGPGRCMYNEIEVWGDGQQTRSFLYIDDCIDAVRLLMEYDFKEPINIGSEEMVTINDLAQMAIDLSGKNITIKNIDGPTGVRGRNSDNTLIRQVLGWEPKYKLHDGIKKTYDWIFQEIKES